MHARLTTLAALALLLAAPGLRAEDEQKTAAAEAPEPVKELAEIPASPAGEKEREGLETWAWRGESGDRLALATVYTKEQPENRLLKLDYIGTRGEKVGAQCLTNLYLAENGKVEFRVYSGEKHPPQMAVAICTGDNYTWQESEPVALKEGWNEFKADFGSKKWKSAASNWKPNVELQERNDVRAIHLLVYNGRASGYLYLDALQFDRDAKFEKQTKDLVKKLGDENFETRESAGQELLKAGRPVLEYLREAIAHGDAETAQRAKSIVEKLEKPAANATAERPEAARRKPRARDREE
ncbi:MAG: hypothetical protein KIS92_25935 [Planctomycetota bacterium]|nr:hypothetical protein [Planctomycetota bacterium]